MDSTQTNSSQTVTAETVCVSAMEEMPEAVRKFATGDIKSLDAIKRKALELSDGKVSEREITEVLHHKLHGIA